MRRRFMSTLKIEGEENTYMYIEALNDGLAVSFSINNIEYSIDSGNSWSTLEADTTSPSINRGERIYFKALGLTPHYNYGIGTFSISRPCNIGGNVMSLLFGDSFANEVSLEGYSDAFLRLFYNCYRIKRVSKNFLPATTLASNCYDSMFYGCTSLVNAPELPTTTLASNCYDSMFYGCYNLNYIKALFTTTPSSSYTNYWVSNVASTGTFVKSKDATWDVTGANGVPSGWTVLTDEEESGGGDEVSKSNNYIDIVISPSGKTHNLDITCTYPLASDITFQCNVIDFSTMQPTIEIFTLSKGFQSGVVTVAYLSDGNFVITPTEDDMYFYIIR